MRHKDWRVIDMTRESKESSKKCDCQRVILRKRKLKKDDQRILEKQRTWLACQRVINGHGLLKKELDWPKNQ